MSARTSPSGLGGPSDEPSLLDKLDQFAPAPLKSFDAFPKLPSTYKSRSESRGFLTLFVGLLAFLLVLNDIGEFVWGWPDYEFSVDRDVESFMKVNVDLVVNMPCKCECCDRGVHSLLLTRSRRALLSCVCCMCAVDLSVDLRDVMGDRMYLSKGFRRDGVRSCPFFCL